jgi:hypothetical protein
MPAGTLRGLWGGGYCVEVDYDVTPTPEQEALLLDWITQHGLCPEPGDGNPPSAPTEPDPPPSMTEEELVAEASDVWVEVPLATPDPEIAPGFMLVGKYAFLEPHTSLERVEASTDTPIGLLELRADSHYRVDWDDADSPGWRDYFVEGAPWPDGQIRHLYQHAGVYDVTVEQVWQAEWRIAGGEWNTIDLQRQRAATIEDFEVIEVQAVRQD